MYGVDENNDRSYGMQKLRDDLQRLQEDVSLMRDEFRKDIHEIKETQDHQQRDISTFYRALHGDEKSGMSRGLIQIVTNLTNKVDSINEGIRFEKRFTEHTDKVVKRWASIVGAVMTLAAGSVFILNLVEALRTILANSP